MALVSYTSGFLAFFDSFESCLFLRTQVCTVLNGTPNSSATTLMAFVSVGCL